MTDFHDLQLKEQLLLQQKWEDDVDVDEGNVCDFCVRSVKPNKFLSEVQFDAIPHLCAFVGVLPPCFQTCFCMKKKRTALDADQSQVTKSAKKLRLVGSEPMLGSLQNNAYTTGPAADSDMSPIRNHVQTER